MSRSYGRSFAKALSLGLISVLLLNVASLIFNHIGFPIEASAQQSRTIHVAFNYEYFQQYAGTSQSWTYTGSADLTPVDGGYDGIGTGTYEGLDEAPPFADCTEPQRTMYSGTADLTVNAQYSIDNSVTGGPDTSMYNSTTTVIELLVSGDNISAESTGEWDGSHGCTTQSWTASVGFDCHFYGIDFSVGGTYQKADEDAPDSSKCSITITSVAEDLRIFGTVKGLFGSQGTEGLSNSRVVMARLDEASAEKLSTSKPNFLKKTATTDDDSAKYEFTFGRDPGRLPAILVVSLLWYEGKPEFAITNGKETAGRLIPVYQALCVDDSPASKCEKWKETSYGYEAEVNFEYGSEDKLLENWQIMEPEEWMGINLQNSGGPPSSGTATYSSTGTTVMMADSAYMYYNGYRAMKYFETLGLRSPLNPLVIRSHDFDPNCPTAGAWYNGKGIDPAFSRWFGDLGTFTDRVEATGGETVLCDVDQNSSLDYPENPKMPFWHEIGHYLQFQMYDADNLPGQGHAGYANPNTNDSFVEGFASFVAFLIDEYYGGPNPSEFYGVDKELDIKVWGDGTDEENAISGILWDFHDQGIEINRGHFLNATISGGSYFGGTLTQVSRVYPQSLDQVSLGASTILNVIDRNEVNTLVDLYNAFVSTQISAVDLDMILVNHGAFADVVNRNYVHDSAAEKPGETGSKTSPVRLIRSTPPPHLPGSYIVSDTDSTYNVTVNFESPFSYYDYSYLREMKTGERMYFTMPPQYYPSVATITPVSADGEQSPLEPIKIQSDVYWSYVHSNPPRDAIFKHVSESGDTSAVTAMQYIQNVRDLLSRTSAEYKAGNYTGAEELATMAYLDNFKQIESDLDQRNATELKEQTAQLMHVELLGLIRDKADPQAVDGKIAEINSKLDEAIVVVPEFPLGISLLIVAFALTSAILLVRFKRKDVGAASGHLAI